MIFMKLSSYTVNFMTHGAGVQTTGYGQYGHVVKIFYTEFSSVRSQSLEIDHMYCYNVHIVLFLNFVNPLPSG